MPATLTYPGVYIEEIPSGVRTIVGVATSITAFLGRAQRGPTDEPITINSFGDFTRTFGDLNVDYPMGYAVRDFYLNGGQQAIIVRLQKNAGKSKNTDLKLEAASAGKWGDQMTFTVDTNGITDDVATRYGIAKADLFNLTVYEDKENPTKGRVERSLNVSTGNGAGARRLDRVLESSSNLVRVQKKNDGTPDLAATPQASKPEEDPSDPKADKTKFKAFTSGADSALLTKDTEVLGDQNNKTGMYALQKADLFNLLCIPPDTRSGDTITEVYQSAMKYCADRRAMLIVDSPGGWSANKETAAATARDKLSTDLALTGEASRNAALFFPRVKESDPNRDGQIDTFVPCGIVAGVMARTDVNRGVWKASAGLDASINGIQELTVNLSDGENGMLNPLGINCLRTFPITGSVVWGARTLRGADQLADEYKYIPVRRLALYLEESLYRGLKWVVFEPNDEPLWAQIRLNVGAFMQNLFRQGAFQGKTPSEAYFVKCDKETTTQNDINLGIVNIVVGFAPLKPAEFVVIKIQQIAGQIAT